MTQDKKLKIAIIGTGAMGGYFAARLAHAGHDVHMLLRSDYKYVKQNGLKLKQLGEEIHIQPANAHNTTTTIGVSDLVIVSLKTTSNSALPALLKPIVGEKTIIITVQNGMGNVELLGKHFGIEKVLGGVNRLVLNRIAPGVVESFSKDRGVIVGEAQGTPQSRTQDIVDLFNTAHIPSTLGESFKADLWKKLCWNIPFNGLSVAAGGVTTDIIIGEDHLNKMMFALLKEIQEAAAKDGVNIDETFLHEQVKSTKEIGAYKPSSMIDYQKGLEVEVEGIWGEPLRRGQSLGVPMPHLESLYWLLKEMGKPRQV